jgi:hypothetical protein
MNLLFLLFQIRKLFNGLVQVLLVRSSITRKKPTFDLLFDIVKLFKGIVTLVIALMRRSLPEPHLLAFCSYLLENL